MARSTSRLPGTIFAWSLWAGMSACIIGAFYYAPLAAGFIGQSSRILFFHVPCAWVSLIAFIAAGVWSLLYLAAGRHERHDHAARISVELGLLFCVLATVSGALWAKVMWGAYWNWDPRQTSISMALLFYAAYSVLRNAIEDPDARRRIAATYAILGVVISPFLFFVLPRITFSLHPESVINAQGKIDMDSKMLQVLLASLLMYTVLFLWLHRLRLRVATMEERNADRGRI